jgi:hypothetical protein
LDEYHLAKKQPYGLEYFGIDKPVKLYTEYAEGLDEFVKEQIESNQLENNLESYKVIMDSIMASMMLSDEIRGSAKLEKIYKWVTKILGPQRKLEEKKRKILGA